MPCGPDTDRGLPGLLHAGVGGSVAIATVAFRWLIARVVNLQLNHSRAVTRTERLAPINSRP